MLSKEANERLTRVGPGTPMGELMRRYWQPVRPFSQLLDEEVIKIKILGEELVLYRTTTGKLGLIDSHCPHRQTGLEYGIPDEEGLRCCYHGWLIGPSGDCLDTPLEAIDSKFKHKIKVTAYPVQVAWTGADWKLVLPTQEDDIDAAEIQALDGFTTWDEDSK